MLAALAQGVKSGKWHSLIDKFYPIATLRAAFAAVSANQGAAGVDHVTIERYAADLDANLERLSEGLRRGTYRPQAIGRHYIPKLGSQETASTSHTDHPGPGGSDGAAHCAGTHL